MLIPDDLAVFPPALPLKLVELQLRRHMSFHWTDDRPAPSMSEALGKTVDRYLAPFSPAKTRHLARDRLGESESAETMREIAAVLKLAMLPIDALTVATAVLTTKLSAACESSAATTLSVHLGNPHMHNHPPLIPLPSIGPVLLGNCVSVLIGGWPAARVDDFGVAISCCTLSPPFQITSGSSKVYIGGKRAARVGDFTKHCQKASKVTPVWEVFIQALPTAAAIALSHTERKRHARDRQEASEAAANAVNGSQQALASTLAAESKGHALAAETQGQQAIHNVAALAASVLMGKDPSTIPCYGALLTGDPTVVIGGFPLPSHGGALGSISKLGGVKKVLTLITRSNQAADIFYAMSRGSSPMGRTSNALPRERCVLTGHPVDVVNGRLVFDACDLELPGALPLRLDRSYSSTWSTRRSTLGRGWSHSFEEAVWLERDRLVYRTDDGRELELPIQGDESYLPQHRLTLRRLPDHRWQIEDHHGVRRDFASIPGDPHPDIARLTERRDRLGHTLRCIHDEHARLIAIQADGERELRLHYNDDGLLAQLDLPDPDGPGFLPHVRYFYERDNLTEVHDALGHITRYRHEHHRIVEEQLPSGLRFHFTYDSDAPDAACVRTWGDGGIIDHRLIFDQARRTTVVINACQETTIYRADPRGLVIEIQDPRGAITRFTHDEHLRPATIVDPLGHVTRFEYDPAATASVTTPPTAASPRPLMTAASTSPSPSPTPPVASGAGPTTPTAACSAAPTRSDAAPPTITTCPPRQAIASPPSSTPTAAASVAPSTPPAACSASTCPMGHRSKTSSTAAAACAAASTSAAASRPATTTCSAASPATACPMASSATSATIPPATSFAPSTRAAIFTAPTPASAGSPRAATARRHPSPSNATSRAASPASPDPPAHCSASSATPPAACAPPSTPSAFAVASPATCAAASSSCATNTNQRSASPATPSAASSPWTTPRAASASTTATPTAPTAPFSPPSAITPTA